MPGHDGNSNQRASHAHLQGLLAEAKTGSNSALGRALEACRPRMLRAARKAVDRQLRPRVGGSDVVQDAFINATRAFRVFRGQHAGEFLAWLYKILLNRLSEVARRESLARRRDVRRQPAEAGVPWIRRAAVDDPSPSSIAVVREFADLIRAGVERLNARDQEVLRLRFDQGLNHAQIGARLGLSEDGARALFCRAVERLKRELPVELAV